MMSGHAKRFPGCAYGPMALRPLLRRTLQPGERLLAFGSADTAASGWRAVKLLALALPVGSVWSHRLLRRRRVLVVTDRRLMVLPPDRADLDPCSVRWNAEFPLTQVTLRRGGKGWVRVETPGGGFVARLRGRWVGQELSTACPGPGDRGTPDRPSGFADRVR